MKKAIALFLAAVLILGVSVLGVTAAGAGPSDAPETSAIPATAALAALPATPEIHPGMSNFQRANAYSDGLFTDVAPEEWYNPNVGTAYELGLMEGVSGGRFDPDGQVTMAQAIVMAVRLHSIYNTGSGEFPVTDPWYEPYVSYGTEHGIMTGDPDLYAVAARAQFADILSRALPEGDLEQINEIDENAIPDVKTGDAYAESIYRLYRAGIVAGSTSRHAFYPASGISRAEAAAIIARMTDKTLRVSFSLQYSGPDLTALESKDDSFFEHSAILGNSLVEGLRLFSNLKSIHYFSATSVSVISATQTRNVRLRDGSTGTLIQSLCQDQYDKIYIELGINEIGGSVNTFIRNYGGMIDSIRAAEPDADIYILSILPVTRNKSASSTVFNMTRINTYNQALYQLAGEKQCYYMDVCSAFQDSDGYLPYAWSSDGVHLYARYYSVWENCMRTLY